MFTQKSIYHNWIKRFDYPATKLETQAQKAFQGVKKISTLSKKNLHKSLKNRHLIAVGDDASIGMQQETFIRDVLTPLRRGKILVITNRQNPEILLLLKKNGVTVKSIRPTEFNRENAQMAKLVEQWGHRYDHVLIWTGHLRVSSVKFRKKFTDKKLLSIYLQCNALQWKFPSARSWNKINDDSFVWMDSSPLISVDHHRSIQEEGFILVKPDMLDGLFRQMMRELSKIMGQPRISPPKKLLHVFDDRSIRFIRTIKSISLRSFIQERAMNAESAVIPASKYVLLSTLNASHIAEEAAHYLRTAGNKIEEYGEVMSMVEEALAFFASVILFPNRSMPVSNSDKAWDQIHKKGYGLGFKLVDMWRKSAKNKNMIRKLWKLHPKNEFEAHMMLEVMKGMR